MAKAARLSPAELQAVRGHILANGGVWFVKPCPCPGCHAVVIRFGPAVVCLSCGWTRAEASWGAADFPLTREEAAAGQGHDFRDLIALVAPDRWDRLVRTTHEQAEDSAPAPYADSTSELPCAQGGTAEPATAAPASPLPCAELIERRPPLLPKNAPRVLIYTDGGCEPNPGSGGWAAILCTMGWELELAGGLPETTNNRMEMTAALEGLRALKSPARVTVVTDSQYLHNSMIDWITTWSRRRWIRKGDTIPNADLWQELARAALVHESYWFWTRGHTGQPENERCDQLAAAMIEAVRAEATPSTHHRRKQRKGQLPYLAGVPTAPVWLPLKATGAGTAPSS